MWQTSVTMTVRRAKIVCTVGPAVDSVAGIRGLIQAGMNVARLNFSHGTAEDHAKRVGWIREQSRDLGKHVAILQDLCGPKIRTGTEGPAEAPPGGTMYLVAGTASNEPDTIAISYETLSEDVVAGDRVLLGDGHVELEVEGIVGNKVECRVVHGGPLRSRMGVNLPSRRLRVKALTEKDKLDLAVGLELNVDYVALSFVRSATDVEELRAITQRTRPDLPIVSKVETPGAMDHIDDVVLASDAVMVARGDLGVELPPERVPVLQKQIIESCRLHRRPVIVATEMLQSMVEAPRPTRAEASDVATAVFEGADAVMLSAESASGKFPIQSCAMMSRIIVDAEASAFYSPPASPVGSATQKAIAEAACVIARDIGAKVIVALTQSGSTAQMISKGRPMAPIVAFSPREETSRRVALYWGVVPNFLDMAETMNDIVAQITKHLKENGWVAAGDRYVMSYGAPIRQTGTTNAIRVERVT